MIESIAAGLIFALCVAWYLIRTTRMPDEIDYDPHKETLVKDLPDNEKISINISKAKHYNR